MPYYSVIRSAILIIAVLFVSNRLTFSDPPAADAAVIKEMVRSGFSNGDWNYDRYQDLESLDAGQRATCPRRLLTGCSQRAEGSGSAVSSGPWSNS